MRKEDRARLSTLVPSDRTRDNIQKTPLNIRRGGGGGKPNFFCWGWSNTGIGWPERLQSLHPSRYPKPDWTQSWVTCGIWSYLSGRTRRSPEVLLSLRYSAILWIFSPREISHQTFPSFSTSKKNAMKTILAFKGVQQIVKLMMKQITI